eukprot:1686397-Pleurochrysis_carterae.AAC.1
MHARRARHTTPAARAGMAVERPRILVAFAGDDLAASTPPSELRARGAEIVAIDTKIGGRDHDLARAE